MEDRDTVLDEVREHLTLKTLQEKVWRLEAENKELRVNNSILQTQYNSQCETQSDLLRTLHANLEENFSKIEDLEKENEQLKEHTKELQQEARDKLEEERLSWNDKIDELTLKNESLTSSLNELDEFRKNKEAVEAELASLQKQLLDQAEKHDQNISSFDRKKAMEIEKLKTDMQRHLKETKEMLRARTKDQVPSTTKRIVMENEQMATELHFQSKATQKLDDQNKSLIEDNNQLRLHLKIHKDLEVELARRTHVYQKLIKKMHQRHVSETDASQEEWVSAQESKDCLDTAQGQALKEEAKKCREDVEELQKTLEVVRHEFSEYRRDHATLTQLQDQSTRLVIAALYELKGQKDRDPFPPASYDEHADWQFTNMTARQKEYFFRVLLEKMNNSMCGSCFPHSPRIAPQAVALPPISKTSPPMSQMSTVEPTNFSQFLWSLASIGPQSTMSLRFDCAHKSVQTETDPADPCLKDGLWNPQSRVKLSAVTPTMVSAPVRDWGTRSLSLRNRVAAQKPRLV